MAKPRFTLYKHIKIGGTWRYCRAAVAINNKVKPHIVILSLLVERRRSIRTAPTVSATRTLGEMLLMIQPRRFAAAQSCRSRKVRLSKLPPLPVQSQQGHHCSLHNRPSWFSHFALFAAASMKFRHTQKLRAL